MKKIISLLLITCSLCVNAYPCGKYQTTVFYGEYQRAETVYLVYNTEVKKFNIYCVSACQNAHNVTIEQVIENGLVMPLQFAIEFLKDKDQVPVVTADNYSF